MVSVSPWLHLKWWENNREWSNELWMKEKPSTQHTFRKHWRESILRSKSCKKRRNSWYNNLPETKKAITWLKKIDFQTRYISKWATFMCSKIETNRRGWIVPQWSSLLYSSMMMEMKIKEKITENSLKIQALLCFLRFIHQLKRRN
jgi:hypothetical protein